MRVYGFGVYLDDEVDGEGGGESDSSSRGSKEPWADIGDEQEAETEGRLAEEKKQREKRLAEEKRQRDKER